VLLLLCFGVFTRSRPAASLPIFLCDLCGISVNSVLKSFLAAAQFPIAAPNCPTFL
jgi:hypothetical protein